MRFYRPVPATGGNFADHYAVRGQDRRILAEDMRLSWDQADRLCDILETIRERVLQERADA